jgi:hypothetical protein
MSARIFFRFVTGIVVVASVLTGAETRSEEVKLDKKATDILRQASDLLKNAKSLHVDTKVSYLETGKKPNRVIHSEGLCDVEQPNHFSYRTRRTNEEGGVSVVCDGRSLFTSAKQMKQFTESRAPHDLSKMGMTVMFLDMRNTGMLLPNVIAEEPYEQLMNGVTIGTYAGKTKVGDVPAHHLKFSQDNFQWEIWIAAEGKPLVLKMHTHGPMAANVSFDVAETFDNWKFDEPIASETFTFSPAKDAKKVQNLDGNMEKR